MCTELWASCGGGQLCPESLGTVVFFNAFYCLYRSNRGRLAEGRPVKHGNAGETRSRASVEIDILITGVHPTRRRSAPESRFRGEIRRFGFPPPISTGDSLGPQEDSLPIEAPFMNLVRNFTAVRTLALLCACLAVLSLGCASHQYGHILAGGDKDLVGSHSAGAATWNPLVDESVAKLLGRCPPAVQPVVFEGQGFSETPGQVGSALAEGPARICFVGIENKSAEELGDFKDQLYERIDSQINASDTFRGISRRMVDAALRQTRLRPDSLFLPDNRHLFAAALHQQGSPVDYLLFAKVTSGTTQRNKTSQRDYVLTLEMVNLHTGDFMKESAEIRKGYSKTRAGKWWNFGIFDQADG